MEARLKLELQHSDRVRPVKGPLLIVIMDGIGVGRGDEGDAVAAARTPTLERLRELGAYRTIRAHGIAVGLPSDGDMGNSEVGHNAIGAGRVFAQGALRAKEAIEEGSIYEDEVWGEIRKRCAQGHGALHLIGLLSDGNVHSHERQLHALIREADQEGFPTVYVHVLLDGRDVPETSALTYVDRLEAVLKPIDAKPDRRYRIASGGGRMTTTMDRYENDWGMVERGWNAQVHGKGRTFPSAREAVEAFREEEPGIIDQYLPSFVVAEDGTPVGPMKDGDVVVFFNFRGDRALEVSRAFDAGPEFDKFDRGRVPELYYAGMTLYDGEYRIPKHYLVSPPHIDRTIGEYLASAGVPQFAMAEAQKYGHVTYFWNGNRGGKFDDALETYREIASDSVPFDQRPWMKAAEVTDETIQALSSGLYRFLRINYANGDMVGHTGKFEPTVIAVESVDLCLSRLVPVVEKLQGTLIVTADHGNADDMVERDKTGKPKRRADGALDNRTSHSLNPVGFWVVRFDGESVALRNDLPEAGLANIAATFLELLGFAPPEGYLPSMLA
jgi:2,3-bisphosphoglycerate-independent phosphoglycerate mutase